MIINIIVAMDPNRVIWYQNKLPWHYPEDLQYFKKQTTGHTIIMWRKTFDSIWKPLPNRRNIILTHNKDLSIQWVDIFYSIWWLLSDIRQNESYDCKLWYRWDEEKVFVIWWSQIYEQFLNRADFLYITEIKKEYKGDSFFPEFKDMFKEIKREKHEEFDFVVYKKL